MMKTPSRPTLAPGDHDRRAPAGTAGGFPSAGEDVPGLESRLEQAWRSNALREIACSLAHDLNQPLTAATAYIHAGQKVLERAGTCDDGASHAFDLGRAQLLRAGEMVRAVTGTQDGMVSAPVPVRVEDMIGRLAPILIALARSADVSLTVRLTEPEDHNDLVMADGIQIQQAMVNLVRNALDAVAGRTRREVAVWGEAVSTDLYAFGVEDSGPGITPEEWSLMQRPLTIGEIHGNGFGLSVTRTILKRHGSDLAVRSGEAGGAIFHFSLARVAGREAPE